jgi:hypothetical protein
VVHWWVLGHSNWFIQQTFFCINLVSCFMMFSRDFSSCFFPFFNDDTHIIGLAFVIFQNFQHLFFNLHMWGLWSNFANARFSHLLGCLLASFLLPNFITFWMLLGFWASYLVLLLLILPFYMTNWTRMFVTWMHFQG